MIDIFNSTTRDNWRWQCQCINIVGYTNIAIVNFAKVNACFDRTYGNVISTIEAGIEETTMDFNLDIRLCHLVLHRNQLSHSLNACHNRVLVFGDNLVRKENLTDNLYCIANVPASYDAD